MMKKMKLNLRQLLFTALAALLCFLFAFPFLGCANLYLESVSASAEDYLEIQSYHVEMNIGADRQVRVEEEITVHFLSTRRMFYRTFPIETARYYDISASCDEDPTFSYYIADNEEMEGFFDVNLTGDTTWGRTWTYRISFTMENGWGAASWDNGMLIDVIPFGSTMPFYNVSAVIYFPYAVKAEDCVLYKGLNSTTDATDLNKQLSMDGKTLYFSTPKLSTSYNAEWNNYIVQGVTLEFEMQENFDSYFATRFFTDSMFWLCLGGILIVAIAVVIKTITRKPRELVTVVNFTAPDKMDPMTMGKTLDGTVDNEDITSMIYYFAHMGWLHIDLSDENDPRLIRNVDTLPESATAHEKTLFSGLFALGSSVYVSQLKYKFYAYVDKARLQTKHVKMYDKKSALGYVAGGILAFVFIILTTLLLGRIRLNGYMYGMGVAAALPIGLHLVLGLIRENYRYKWKKPKRVAMSVAIAVVEFIFACVFLFGMAAHITTEFERLVILVCAYACVYSTENALSRREDYLKTLGDIIGFKDFILHTEEDRIKFMLEENPQLYYKILPYAQVLGVTDEWQQKFARILLEPPQWCYGTHATTFDYIMFNRVMTRSMMTAMERPESKGGGHSTGAGGGGSFGSFGGGGFGGGGFGSR